MSRVPAALSGARPTWILWRHVMREMLSPTLLGFVIFTFLLLMRYLLRVSEIWIRWGADLSDVLWSIVYSLPHVVVLTLPMAVLVGTLIALGRMSSDFEIVALRSLGISLLHLVPPVLAFAAVAWGLNSWLFLEALPWGNSRLLELQWNAVSAGAISQEFKPRVFNDSFPGLVLYVEDIVQDGGEWRGVFAARTEDRNPTVLRAERAYPIVDDDARRTYLRLEDGTMVASEDDPVDVTISTFDVQTLLVWDQERDSAIGGPGETERTMTLSQLRESIREREEAGESARNLRVEVHKKYALPFACVILGLVAIPLGTSTQRQTTATGFGIGTLVIVVYYFFIQNGEQQAEAGRIVPWLGMWTANIVLGAYGTVLLWKKTTETDWGLWERVRPFKERAAMAVRRFVERRILHTRSVDAEDPRRERRSLRLGFPRTLDRYILQIYGGIYGLTFSAFVVVWTAVEWLDRASYVEVPSLLPQYFQFRVWFIVFNVIPVAAVVTVLATFGLMAKRNETVAALAGGISLYRQILPVLLPAVLLCASQYALQDYVLPYTAKRAEQIEQRMRDTAPTLQKPRTWVFGTGDRIFHFVDFVEDSREFHDLRVYYLAGGSGIARMEYAERAVWEEGAWLGHEGWRRYYVPAAEGEPLAANPLERFKLSRLPIEEPPSYFARDPRSPQEMSAIELREHIELLREQGFDTAVALVDFHMKLSFPAVTLVMTLVGLPFAFRMGRKGTLTGVAIAIGLVIVYWIAFGVFRAVGYAGQLPPVLAAWAPHLLFLTLAAHQALGIRT